MADGLEPWMVQDHHGSGNSVVRVAQLEGAALVHFQVVGSSSNTILEGLDTRGQMSWLPVNTIGNYQGVRLADGTDDVFAFKVTTDGRWSLSVRPLGNARTWQRGLISGSSDDVLIIPQSVQVFSTVDILARGDTNIAVWTYGDYGRELICNEIGPIQGQTVLPVGTIVVSVEHVGPWSLDWR